MILNSTHHGGQPYHDHDISSRDDCDSLYEDEYDALSEDDYEDWSENAYGAYGYENYDAYSEYNNTYDEDNTTTPSDPFVYPDQSLGQVDVLQLANDGQIYQAYGEPRAGLFVPYVVRIQPTANARPAAFADLLGLPRSVSYRSFPPTVGNPARGLFVRGDGLVMVGDGVVERVLDSWVLWLVGDIPG
jgi:hypothetical protein